MTTIDTPGVGRRSGWWRRVPWRLVAVKGLRCCLLGLWVTWALVGWWSAPRPATVTHAERDIAAGRVVAVTRADHVEQTDSFWAGLPVPQPDGNGRLVAWRTSTGRTWYAEPDGNQRLRDLAERATMQGSGQEPTTVATQSLLDRFAAAGVPESTAWPAGTVAVYCGRALAGLALVLLIAGPTPARATRWFWFWISYLPLGLGVLTWLAVEHPWSARAGRRPGSPEVVPAGGRRWGGLLGFGVSIVAAILLGTVGHLLTRWWGPQVLPWG